MKMCDVTSLVDEEEPPAMEPTVVSSRARRNSEVDVVHHSGNLENSAFYDSSLLDVDGIEDTEVINQRRWELNFREAAIFLQEGENNDKFTTHPRSQADVPAYMITHNIWFYIFSFISSLALLCLALFEEPSVNHLSLPIYVHASLELLFLTAIAIELVLKFRWLGFRLFIRHIRTVIKLLILIIMFVEAIVVMSRQDNHIRITRALRPFFLLDTYYCRGARRFIRQMIQSLPPMIDMLVLLLFFILLFSVLGFYLFAYDKDNMYFKDFSISFVSMFVLMTSSNFPDVMMPAYDKNRWIAFFFIIYICIELFLMMNLFLAVVYSAFMNYEKEKLRKLLIHRRKACSSAFQLLVSAQHPDKVSARSFEGCLKFFRPRLAKRDVYLAFKSLNISRSGKLSEQEFSSVYDALSLKWQRIKSSDIWSANFKHPFNKIGAALHRFVTWKGLEYFIYGVIIANLLWIVSDTIHISIVMQSPLTPDDPTHWIEEEYRFIWVSITFVAIYCVEAILKILGLGPRKYFKSGWNIFDFTVTMVALLGVLFQLLSSSFYALIVVRPLRVLRLFKMKRRFRDIFGTLIILFPRMCRAGLLLIRRPISGSLLTKHKNSLKIKQTQEVINKLGQCVFKHNASFVLKGLGVVMILLYYCFAIIGMEFFGSYSKALINCCKNTSVEEYYTYNDTDGHNGYYYLNNFENIFMSFVTLFELTVVNNWWIIMEGFAAAISPWSRAYFMIFYLVIMIVLTTTMAFILDAFIFRIKYREKNAGSGHGWYTATDRTQSPSFTQQLRNTNKYIIQHKQTYSHSAAIGAGTIGAKSDHAIQKVEIPLSTNEIAMCLSAHQSLSGENILQQEVAAMSASVRNEATDGRLIWYLGERVLGKNDFSLKMYHNEVKEWLATYESSRSSTGTAATRRASRTS